MKIKYLCGCLIIVSYENDRIDVSHVELCNGHKTIYEKWRVDNA